MDAEAALQSTLLRVQQAQAVEVAVLSRILRLTKVLLEGSDASVEVTPSSTAENITKEDGRGGEFGAASSPQVSTIEVLLPCMTHSSTAETDRVVDCCHCCCSWPEGTLPLSACCVRLSTVGLCRAACEQYAALHRVLTGLSSSSDKANPSPWSAASEAPHRFRSARYPSSSKGEGQPDESAFLRGAAAFGGGRPALPTGQVHLLLCEDPLLPNPTAATALQPSEDALSCLSVKNDADDVQTRNAKEKGDSRMSRGDELGCLVSLPTPCSVPQSIPAVRTCTTAAAFRSIPPLQTTSRAGSREQSPRSPTPSTQVEDMENEHSYFPTPPFKSHLRPLDVDGIVTSTVATPPFPGASDGSEGPGEAYSSCPALGAAPGRAPYKRGNTAQEQAVSAHCSNHLSPLDPMPSTPLLPSPRTGTGDLEHNRPSPRLSPPVIQSLRGVQNEREAPLFAATSRPLATALGRARLPPSPAPPGQMTATDILATISALPPPQRPPLRTRRSLRKATLHHVPATETSQSHPMMERESGGARREPERRRKRRYGEDDRFDRAARENAAIYDGVVREHSPYSAADFASAAPAPGETPLDSREGPEKRSRQEGDDAPLYHRCNTENDASALPGFVRTRKDRVEDGKHTARLFDAVRAACGAPLRSSCTAPLSRMEADEACSPERPSSASSTSSLHRTPPQYWDIKFS